MAEAGNDSVRNYTIGKNRIKKASMPGFCFQDEKLLLTKGKKHGFFLPAINSYKSGSLWGILKICANLPEHCILVIRAFAMDIEKQQEKQKEEIDKLLTDEAQTIEAKIAVFENAGCVKVIHSKNLLLYDLKGQYLWFCIEVIGEGNGEISSMYLENPGDNFMQTFPELYQERGSFFHRYMSIFSSIYGEMQNKIENVEQLLDFDTAPSDLLQLYAGWLGLELEGDFLEKQTSRNLLKEIYQLNRMKGTKEALKRLIWLVLKEEPIIVERNLIANIGNGEENVLYNRLYGSSKHDITILINRNSDEKLRAQLLYLVKQFKPARSRVKLVFYKECSKMDSYCYLNKNAVLGSVSNGKIDESSILDGHIILDK